MHRYDQRLLLVKLIKEADYRLPTHPEQLALVVLAGITLLVLFGDHRWRNNAPLLHFRDLAHVQKKLRGAAQSLARGAQAPPAPLTPPTCTWP